jgi:hypothetical protein
MFFMVVRERNDELLLNLSVNGHTRHGIFCLQNRDVIDRLPEPIINSECLPVNGAKTTSVKPVTSMAQRIFARFVYQGTLKFCKSELLRAETQSRRDLFSLRLAP